MLKEHLYSGERDTFSGSQIPGLTFIQGHLSSQNVTDRKEG